MTEDKNTELKPEKLENCPFCGGEADFSPARAKIECQGEWCNALMCGVQGDEELIRAWNARSPDPRDALMQDMAAALEYISKIKSGERVLEDIAAMEGRFCPSFEQTATAILLAIRVNAVQALTAYNEFMEGK